MMNMTNGHHMPPGGHDPAGGHDPTGSHELYAVDPNSTDATCRGNMMVSHVCTVKMYFKKLDSRKNCCNYPKI